MDKYVIIDYMSGVSRFNEYLYNKNMANRLKNVLSETIKISNKEIEVRRIPVSSRFNEKTVVHFIENLKKDNVNKVILSENVRKNNKMTEILKNNLDFCSGRSIIDLFTDEIYEKYITINNKKDYEAELVLFCDNPDRTLNFLKRVCKKLKNVYIVAENYEKFFPIIRKIYDEFGFYIYFTEKVSNVFLKDRIYINLAENTDFIDIDKEKNNIIILNLSGNSINSCSYLNTYVFRISQEFKEAAKFFKYFDQECLEFFINALCDDINTNIIKKFINEYNVKFKKICLKNY